MSCKMLRLSLMVLIAIVIGTYGQECRKCMKENEVKCLDEKTFVFCMGDTAGTTELKCDGTKVCTNSEDICEELDAVAANPDIINVCDKTGAGKCGACPAASSINKRYTCVTSTSFSRCVGGKPIGEPEHCADGLLCSTKLYEVANKICATQATLNELNFDITCEDLAPPNSQEAARECALAAVDFGLVPPFQIPAKNKPCKEYILCESIRGSMFGTHIICPQYYNTETGRCVSNKPRICPAPPSTETPPAEIPSGETSSGETSSGETSSGETSSGETPSGETPSGETPSGETPSGETPSGETSSGETSSGETPSGETPSGETPSGETPSGETPSGETPSGGTPSGETPSGETPSGETPSGETPSGETPSGETPSGETPSGETPSGETSSSEIRKFRFSNIFPLP